MSHANSRGLEFRDYYSKIDGVRKNQRRRLQWTEKGNGFPLSHQPQSFWAEQRQRLVEFSTLAQACVLSFVPAQPSGYTIPQWVQLLDSGGRIKNARHGWQVAEDDTYVVRVCGVSIGISQDYLGRKSSRCWFISAQ